MNTTPAYFRVAHRRSAVSCKRADHPVRLQDGGGMSEMSRASGFLWGIGNMTVAYSEDLFMFTSRSFRLASTLKARSMTMPVGMICAS